MPATNNSAPSYIRTGHKNRFMCGVLFLTYRSLIGETSKKVRLYAINLYNSHHI